MAESTASIQVPAAETDTTRSTGKVLFLQVMRGIAALSVVFYHTSVILGEPRYGGMAMFESTFGKGWIGVNFFFIISGFIILFSHRKDVGQPKRLGRYLSRRFTRVYPLYWVLVSVFIVVAFFGVGQDRPLLDLPNMLTTYTLFQFNAEPHLPLKVAWTLLFEATFYVIFASLILNLRLGLAVFAVWAAAILVHSVLLGYNGWGPTSLWNINFFFGMAAVFLTRRLDGRWAIPVLLAGIVALVAIWPLVPGRPDPAQANPVLMIGLGLVLMVIVVGGILAERQFRVRENSIFVLLGEASYSIYLVHSAAISVMAIVNVKLLHGNIAPTVVFFVVAIVATAAGVAVHLLIEKPLLRLLRPRRALPVAAAVAPAS